MSEANCIAADWRTTPLRVRALSSGGEVLQHAASTRGMGSLAVDQFEAALLEPSDAWLDGGRVTEVVACGMLGGQSLPGQGMRGDQPLDLPAFEAGLRAAGERPLPGALFGRRGEGLLEGLTPTAARARLSGPLIGQELTGLPERWQGLPVCVSGDGEAAEHYRLALAALNVAARLGAEQVILAGLAAAHQPIRGGI